MSENQHTNKNPVQDTEVKTKFNVLVKQMIEDSKVLEQKLFRSIELL